MEPLKVREEWKYVMATRGEQFVMITGVHLMLMLYATNLDIILQVES